MRNAKEEFLNEIKNKKLICAKIMKGYDDDEDNLRIILKRYFTEDDLNNFLDNLDFEYNSGYGGQELFGMILFEDSWSTRGEYDGSEWWENHKMPTMEEVYKFSREV